MIQIYLPDEQATNKLGQKLARWLRTGDIVLLKGDLGSGKSALSRACIQAMPNANDTSSSEEVPSPTFTLVQSYERIAGTVWHFDLYRLGDAEELYELGWEDASTDGICLIEWPDRLGYLAPQSFLEIELLHEGEGRIAKLDLSNLLTERAIALKDLISG